MSLTTAWGYDLTAATELTDMLTTAEYNAFTASKYSGDARIAPEIASACSAIRNFCGWHIYPSLACDFKKTLLRGDGEVKRVGPDLLIQLPARFVTAVTEVLIDDTDYTADADINRNGMLTIFDAYKADMTRKSVIEVSYTAGLTSDFMDAIKELIAHQVTHALATSYGVTSESAGGMSVTYNASWANNTRASGLSASDKEVLMPYRVQGVF